jgi:hypothetical protein
MIKTGLLAILKWNIHVKVGFLAALESYVMIVNPILYSMPMVQTILWEARIYANFEV